MNFIKQRPFKKRFPSNLEIILKVSELNYYGNFQKKLLVEFEFLDEVKTFYVDGERGYFSDVKKVIEGRIIEKVEMLKRAMIENKKEELKKERSRKIERIVLKYKKKCNFRSLYKRLPKYILLHKHDLHYNPCRAYLKDKDNEIGYFLKCGAGTTFSSYYGNKWNTDYGDKFKVLLMIYLKIKNLTLHNKITTIKHEL